MPSPEKSWTNTAVPPPSKVIDWVVDAYTRGVEAKLAFEFLDYFALSGSTMLLEWLNAMPGFTAHRYSDFPMLWTPIHFL